MGDSYDFAIKSEDRLLVIKNFKELEDILNK
jgi:hypothetical protein